MGSSLCLYYTSQMTKMGRELRDVLVLHQAR